MSFVDMWRSRPTNAPSGGWHCWLFIDGQWQKIAGPLRIGDAARKLSREVDKAGLKDKQSCLTRGSAPTYTPNG